MHVLVPFLLGVPRWPRAALRRPKGCRPEQSAGSFWTSRNLAIPGVTVTATSPALQGSRAAVTDGDGSFAIPALPPGVYQVQYELTGFATATQSSNVALGLTVEQKVTMRAAALAESVQVVAETPAPIATASGGLNVQKEEVDQLAMPRTEPEGSRRWPRR